MASSVRRGSVVVAALVAALTIGLARPAPAFQEIIAPLLPPALAGVGGGLITAGGVTTGGAAAGGVLFVAGTAPVTVPAAVVGAAVAGTAGAAYVGYRKLAGDGWPWEWNDGAADPAVVNTQSLEMVNDLGVSIVQAETTWQNGQGHDWGRSVRVQLEFADGLDFNIGGNAYPYDAVGTHIYDYCAGLGVGVTSVQSWYRTSPVPPGTTMWSGWMRCGPGAGGLASQPEVTDIVLAGNDAGQLTVLGTPTYTAPAPAFDGDPLATAVITSTIECTGWDAGLGQTVARTVEVDSPPYLPTEPVPMIPEAECAPDERLTDATVTRRVPGTAVDDFVLMDGFEGVTIPDSVPQEWMEEHWDEECDRQAEQVFAVALAAGASESSAAQSAEDHYNDCMDLYLLGYEDCIGMWIGDFGPDFDPETPCEVGIFERPEEFPDPIDPIVVPPVPCDVLNCNGWWNDPKRDSKYECWWYRPSTGTGIPLPLDQCVAHQWKIDPDSGAIQTLDPNTDDGWSPGVRPGTQPQPNPDPSPSPSPGTLPNPNPDGQPDGAPRPDDGCMSRDVEEGTGWMSRWVFRGVSCALEWAFVPSEATLTEVETTIQTATTKAPFSYMTSVVGWVGDFSDIPTSCLDIGPVFPEGQGIARTELTVIDSCGAHAVTDEVESYRPILTVAVWGFFILPFAWWAWRQYAPGSQGDA